MEICSRVSNRRKTLQAGDTGEQGWEESLACAGGGDRITVGTRGLPKVLSSREKLGELY